MNKPMSPSNQQTPTVITDGQIEKAVDVLRSTLRKHRDELTTEVAQSVVTWKGLGDGFLTVVRKGVERFSKLIMRIVKVDRKRTPEEVIAATCRKQYVTAAVVASMPKGSGDEAKVIFFKPDKSAYDENDWMSDEKLEQEFALRNLKPTDPYSLAAVNEADSAFADEHPNATHWKDVDGKWCYAAFVRWYGGRYVGVNRNDCDWGDRWWFAGLAS